MNRENLRSLWDEHSRPVYAYLLRLTKNPDDARDHLQELFCRLARQPDLAATLQGDGRGFLLRMARNGVVDQARRAQVRDRIFEKINAARHGESIPAGDPDQALIRKALEQALHTLPADQRHVMMERLWKKRTLDEIALELGVSINTVASRFRYGLDKMRGVLRALYEDLVTSASPDSSKPMKQNPTHPLAETEVPIIQPLEQRRVPSATGAVFALPVLPADDHATDDTTVEATTEITPDVSVDEVPAIAICDLPIPLLLPVDGEFSVDPVLIDDGGLPADFAEPPIAFDDVIDYIDKNSGEVVDGGVADGELDDMIFWTFGGPVTDGDDAHIIVDPVVDDDGGVLIADPLEGEFDHGGLIDGEAEIGVEFEHGEVGAEGESHDGEVVDGEAHDGGPGQDGEGHDGTETDHAENGGVVPIDWVKRGSHSQPDTGAPEDGTLPPEVIYYSMAGGVHFDDVPVATTADHSGVDHGVTDVPMEKDVETTAGDHTAAPEVHHTSSDIHSATHDLHTTTQATEIAPLSVSVSNGGNVQNFVGGTFTSFTVTDLHGMETHDHATHDSADHSPASTPLAGNSSLGSPVDAPEIHWHSAAFDDHDSADHASVEPDAHWVPLHDHAPSTELAQTGDHAHDTAPHATAPTAETTDVIGDVAHATPASGAAMAATGAILAGGATGRRTRKQVE